MTAFVLDSSIALSWYFEDEVSEAADLLLERLEFETAAVPALWHLEVANVIANAERRGRVLRGRSAEFIAQLEALTIAVDDETASRAFVQVLDLARSQRLTAYDAAYLELAMRLGVPLATKDGALRDAATRIGVTVLEAD
jgi:predicted nucleic acid-binding protein